MGMTATTVVVMVVGTQAQHRGGNKGARIPLRVCSVEGEAGPGAISLRIFMHSRPPLPPSLGVMVVCLRGRMACACHQNTRQ